MLHPRQNKQQDVGPTAHGYKSVQTFQKNGEVVHFLH